MKTGIVFRGRVFLFHILFFIVFVCVCVCVYRINNLSSFKSQSAIAFSVYKYITYSFRQKTTGNDSFWSRKMVLTVGFPSMNRHMIKFKNFFFIVSVSEKLNFKFPRAVGLLSNLT